MLRALDCANEENPTGLHVDSRQYAFSFAIDSPSAIPADFGNVPTPGEIRAGAFVPGGESDHLGVPSVQRKSCSCDGRRIARAGASVGRRSSGPRANPGNRGLRVGADAPGGLGPLLLERRGNAGQLQPAQQRSNRSSYPADRTRSPSMNTAKTGHRRTLQNRPTRNGGTRVVIPCRKVVRQERKLSSSSLTPYTGRAWTEGTAPQGCDRSAASGADTCGRQGRLHKESAGAKAINPRGPGTESPSKRVRFIGRFPQRRSWCANCADRI